MSDITEILQLQLPFFKEEGLRRELAEKGTIVTVAETSSILKEGSYVKTIPIILEGLAKVIRREAGKEILLYYIYPLESCIISFHCGLHQLKSTVQAIVEEDSRAFLLPSQYVEDWQRKYPSFNTFYFNLYQKRFYDLLDAFNAMAFHRLDERLIDYLKAKSRILSAAKLKITHQDLGDELGSARETISRLLKKLEVEKKVKLGRGWIEVL